MIKSKIRAEGTSERSPDLRIVPDGLCADRTDHDPYFHFSASLGRFWCTADQDRREPYRSERARRC